MTLELTRRTVDRTAGVPLQRQLAEVIRTAVRDGQLRSGDELPPEKQMAEAVGVNLTTVRRAIAELATEGLVIRTQGRPSRIAETHPVRHMASNRYSEELALLQSGAQHPPVSAFSRDHGVGLSSVTVEPEFFECVATDTDAGLLGVDEGSPVFRRHFRKSVKGQPVQIQRSTMPLDQVRGTSLTDPSLQPWPGGTIAELYSIGIVVTRVTEDVGARMPNHAERSLLELASEGQPVLDVVRVFEAEDKPVEASRVIVPAAYYRLRYEIPLK